MILVTGAGGKIGSQLIDLLNSVSFRAAYHSPPKVREALDRGLDATAIDYADPLTLESAVQGARTVFLLSAGPGQVHLESNMVAAARSAGVRRIVKLSVWKAADEAYSIAREHRAIEREIESSGMEWTFLRPNGFMQNYLGDAATIKAQGAFYRQAMDKGVSYIDARDIAKAAAAVLTGSGHEGKAYELSGPESLTAPDTAAILSRVLQKPVSHIPVSAETARMAMQNAGLPGPLIDSIESIMHAYQTGLGAPVTPDLDQLIGQPSIKFEQFIRDHLTYFQ